MITINRRIYADMAFRCTGVEWAVVAGAALSAAGTGTQMYAASAEKAEADRKVRQELLRQQQYDQKARTVFQQSANQSGVDTANQQLQQGAQTRSNEYNKLEAIPLDASMSSSVLEASKTPAQISGEQGRNETEKSARAESGGYSDWDLHQWIKNIRANQSLGMIGQQAKGSVAILPYELQDAARSQGDLKAAGMGLSALGSLVGAYGAIAPALAASHGAGMAAGAGASTEAVGAMGGESANAAFYGYPRAGAQVPAGQYYGWNYLNRPKGQLLDLPNAYLSLGH